MAACTTNENPPSRWECDFDGPHHPHTPQPGNRKPPPEAYRWKPGQSGNPGGRPRGESITAKLRRVLEQEHGGKAIADLVAERIVKEALSGKFPFAKELLDRVEGRVTETHEIKARVHWRDALQDMTDDEFVALAIKHNRVDLLPPRLAERANAILEGSDGT
jgi:hypothetical protein